MNGALRFTYCGVGPSARLLAPLSTLQSGAAVGGISMSVALGKISKFNLGARVDILLLGYWTFDVFRYNMIK